MVPFHDVGCLGRDRPSLRDLSNHVIPDVANKWKYLGIQLLDPEHQRELDTIEVNHSQDVKECCLSMLKKWLDATEDASWNQLLEALRSRSVDLNTLANQIEKSFTMECEYWISTSRGWVSHP